MTREEKNQIKRRIQTFHELLFISVATTVISMFAVFIFHRGIGLYVFGSIIIVWAFLIVIFVNQIETNELKLRDRLKFLKKQREFNFVVICIDKLRKGNIEEATSIYLSSIHDQFYNKMLFGFFVNEYLHSIDPVYIAEGERLLNEFYQKNNKFLT
jgi:hypothetical protein